MAFQPSQIKVLANAGPRISHRDFKGGGTITRTFYAEPYSAYPFVELMLKGTVIPNGDGTWSRVRPHADPIAVNSSGAPTFYCSDVVVQPFSPEAIDGMAVAQFAPSTDYSVKVITNAAPASQQQQVANVLNCVDDHSYGNIVDFAAAPPLTVNQIKDGGIQFPLDHTSTGRCGAYITATYTPLIFLDGLPSYLSNTTGGGGNNTVDIFDFVNPIWKPVELNTQSGRSLFLYSYRNDLIVHKDLFLNGGLLDTFVKPEVAWEFSITRLMVPFLPHLTLGCLNNKLNGSATSLGNVSIPLRTARFMAPEPPPLCMSPDGATFYNITYKYLLRKLYDEYLDVPTFQAKPGLYPAGVIKGWVDWNHHFGIPSARIWPNLETGQASHYPVSWSGGQFQFFGANHPLYLQDQDMSGLAPSPVPGIGAFQLLNTEFFVGFKAGQ